MNDLAEWKKKLKDKGIRCTKQRVEILNILIKHSKPLTAKEIDKRLKETEVDLRLSTIYRTLNLLEREKFIELFDETGFVVEDVFGNFSLEPFDLNTSDRLIFICKKK